MIEKNKLITAMVTPFNIHGEVDHKTSKKLAKSLSETGSDGILIGGTTGESPTLSNDEKLELFKTVKEAVGDSADVIAGTTDNLSLIHI